MKVWFVPVPNGITLVGSESGPAIKFEFGNSVWQDMLNIV